MEAAAVYTKAEILNYFRFNRLVGVVQARYMARVFTWLHDGRSQSLDEFFRAKPSLLGNFYKFEKKKILQGTDPANMDITLLYKLLVYASDISATPRWDIPVKKGKEPSLGQVLYQLKKVRNENAHKGPEVLTKVTDDDLDTLAMKQKCLLTQMLTLAGRKAGKSQDTINEVVASMEADVAAERLAEGGITVEQFVSLARRELLQNKNNQECPHYVEPRLVVKTHDAFIGSVVRLSDLFSHTFQDGSRPQVIHVTGEAGAGKTSLCQAVFSSWLTEGQLAQATAAYQLVLSIACARVRSSDLHRYLRTWTLPETTRWCEDTASLTRLLREAKVLWLVDGWDEATREARGLLHEVLHSKTESHTVLVTCRPELSASLSELPVENVLKVSFVGLDNDERKELIKGMNLKHVRNKSIENFLHRLRGFLSEETELNNPKNLRLLTELWCAEQCPIGKRHLPSVVQIYMYRTQSQRQDLVARCQADAAPSLDVAGKVDAWLRRLYEVSFSSAKSSSLLILDKKSENILLQECGIPATLCLSTFLGYVPSTDKTSHSPLYTFSHDSQRCFYAARYLEYCCEGAANVEAKLTTIIAGDLKELDYHLDPHLGVFDLIVQILLVIKIMLSRITCGWLCLKASREDLYEVVSRLMRKFLHLVGIHLPRERWTNASLVKCRLSPVLLTVMEMWTNGLFQVNISARFLIDMLARLLEGSGDPARWLEVVRRCGDHDDLVKEVSLKISTKLWEIHGRDVRAATMLLRHVTPAEVKVVVSGDPGRLSHLRDLLSVLAERRITLELHLLTHLRCVNSEELSDIYLGLVCRERSRCRLRAFTGHLSNHGLLSLTAAPYLSALSLRIMQTSAVQELTAVTPQLARLKSLNLVYDNKMFVAPLSSLDGSICDIVHNGIKSILALNGICRNLKVDLQLPHLRDRSVDAAIDFISGLSNRYKTLIVRQLKPKGVKALVAGLSNSAVSVSNVRLPVYGKGYRQFFVFDFGKLASPGYTKRLYRPFARRS